jgi:hypothetical protein
MKTLKGFMYLLILSIFLFNFGCVPRVDDPSPKAKNIPKGLLGRWEVITYDILKKEKGTTTSRLLGTFGKGLAYIFYDNNTFDGCIQAGSDWDNSGATGTIGQWNCTSNKPGIWELKDFNIVDGFLKIDSGIILRTPSQNITQAFFINFHSSSVLSLYAEEQDKDGGTILKVLTFNKVN